ncbi:GNAT family N-acetyltransferase [Streptomyces sp. NPDC048001]|uniref:GNAT family N-acetyltransferase n=1 Tax=Streptomyces sp. NPDC048001 TaxID=3365498 RepID=UPI00371058E7
MNAVPVPVAPPARPEPGGAPDPAVRRATAADTRRLTSLVRNSRAYRGRYAAMVSGYTVGPGYVETHEVFLAEDAAGRVLGFYALVLSPPELDLMFVSDAAQGLGVGRLLAGHMVERARAAGLDHVRVVSHPPAEGFYTSVGARRTGTVRAVPSSVPWDRPELRFDLSPAPAGSGGAP